MTLEGLEQVEHCVVIVEHGVEAKGEERPCLQGQGDQERIEPILVSHCLQDLSDPEWLKPSASGEGWKRAV